MLFVKTPSSPADCVGFVTQQWEGRKVWNSVMLLVERRATTMSEATSNEGDRYFFFTSLAQQRAFYLFSSLRSLSDNRIFILTRYRLLTATVTLAPSRS